MKKKKKTKRKVKTKGNWFNIFFCLLGFFFILLYQIDFIAWYFFNAFEPTSTSCLIIAILILYTLTFLVVLGSGFIFNLTSKFVPHKFAKIYKKFPILVELDNALDWLLWWLIPLFLMGVFILDAIVVECFYYSCI